MHNVARHFARRKSRVVSEPCLRLSGLRYDYLHVSLYTLVSCGLQPFTPPQEIVIQVDKMMGTFRLELFPEVLEELRDAVSVQYYNFDYALGTPIWVGLPVTTSLELGPKVGYILLRARPGTSPQTPRPFTLARQAERR